MDGLLHCNPTQLYNEWRHQRRGGSVAVAETDDMIMV